MTAVESLALEHRTILEVLGLLETVAVRIERGGHVEAAMLGNLLGLCERCVQRVPRREEEQGLFPALEAPRPRARHHRGVGPSRPAQTAGVFLREMRGAANRLASATVVAARVRVWVRRLRGWCASTSASRISTSTAWSRTPCTRPTMPRCGRASTDRRHGQPARGAARCRSLIARTAKWRIPGRIRARPAPVPRRTAGVQPTSSPKAVPCWVPPPRV